MGGGSQPLTSQRNCHQHLVTESGPYLIKCALYSIPCVQYLLTYPLLFLPNLSCPPFSHLIAFAYLMPILFFSDTTTPYLASGSAFGLLCWQESACSAVAKAAQKLRDRGVPLETPQ
jgi:hypothetical protein